MQCRQPNVLSVQILFEHQLELLGELNRNRRDQYETAFVLSDWGRYLIACLGM